MDQDQQVSELSRQLAIFLTGLKDQSQVEQARSILEAPAGWKIVKIDLTAGYPEGAPKKIFIPWRSFWVFNATDPNVTANLSAHSRTIGSLEDSMPIKRGVRYNGKFLVSETFITAEAQPGKEMYIFFLEDGEIDPGSQENVTSGSVAITTGDTIATPFNDTAVAAVTATKILDADADRKLAIIQNNSGGDAYIGGPAVSNTGANRGLRIEAEQSLPWHSPAETWIIFDAIGDVHVTILK